MSLAALEATVVSTAMPTVIATLGGLAHYSWVFTAYLLTSTASVPIFGRLSDLYGRRRMYLTGVVLFLGGSILCGASGSMGFLIAARLLQGLGAGALIPMSMTIVGELYTLAERARVQALFSGVWGVASIAGPLVGGYITDTISWRWVFYVNIPFGLCCLVMIVMAYPATRLTKKVTVDWLGAGLLFGGISTLLIALSDDNGSPLGWGALTVGLLTWFVVNERRSKEPMMPLDLLRLPIIARSVGVVLLVGFALFGAVSFIPLYVQTVLGGTATQAGQMLTPLFLGWVVMSIVGARITVKMGYRLSSIGGSVLVTIAFIGMGLLTADSPRWYLLVACTVMGAGMGTQMLSLLLAVQHAVPRTQLGLATSLTQFSRSIGAAVGVAVMGGILARSIAGVVPSGGIDALASAGVALAEPVRQQFAIALHRAFLAGLVAAGGGLVAALFLPHVDMSQPVPTSSTGERMLEAEMASLRPEDEPVAVPE